MRENNSILVLICIVVLMCGGQRMLAQNTLAIAGVSGESIHLFTDRSLYVVNEKICFAGTYSAEYEKIGKVKSSVLYVELIKWNGSKIVQQKSIIQDGEFGGSLKIPADLMSGNYYLRAYTKWMRNYSPYTYVYLPVKIVNPFSEAIEIPPKENSSIEKIEELKVIERASAISIAGLQENYKERSLVELDLRVSDEKYSGDYCLSIVKAGTYIDSFALFSICSDDQYEKGVELLFLPEIRGQSLSGRIREKESGKPLPDMKLYLSSSSNAFYFSTATSDQDGAFLFTFPLGAGNYEFNLSAECDSETNYEWLIDSEYCNKPVTLPYQSFTLCDQEVVLFEEISKNMQISERFPGCEERTVVYNDQHPFYGSSTRTIYEEEFIELENIEEFIFELIYEVAVRDIDGERKLVTTGDYSSLSSYPILVLVDNVIVDNMDDFLKVSCRKLDRIEVLKKAYVIGDNLYSGILSVYSLNKDMAGLKPPENSMFFDMSLYHTDECKFPKYESEEEQKSRIPDLRTTIFWLPALELANDTLTKLSFYTSDVSGEFELVLRGLNNEGNSIIQVIDRFTVE